MWRLGRYVLVLVSTDVICPSFVIYSPDFILVVEVLENVFESFLLHDDSNLLNAAEEVVEVDRSFVSDVEVF